MSFFSCFFPVHTTQGNPHTQHIRIGWWWWSITNNSCFAGYSVFTMVGVFSVYANWHFPDVDFHLIHFHSLSSFVRFFFRFSLCIWIIFTDSLFLLMNVIFIIFIICICFLSIESTFFQWLSSWFDGFGPIRSNYMFHLDKRKRKLCFFIWLLSSWLFYASIVCILYVCFPIISW